MIELALSNNQKRMNKNKQITTRQNVIRLYQHICYCDQNLYLIRFKTFKNVFDNTQSKMEVYADGGNEKDIEARVRLALVIVTSVGKVRLPASFSS